VEAMNELYPTTIEAEAKQIPPKAA
jgi:hypothetical protein